MKWTDGDKTLEMDSGVQHNPKPTTPRGKRRHANRSDSEKARVEKLWQKK